MDTQRKLIVAMTVYMAFAVPNIASAASISGQGTWEATLQGRDLDGDLTTAEAYYDTVLGITWLADANLAASNTFGVAGINNDGTMNWYTANSLISAMNANSYLGLTGWRLPLARPIDGTTDDDQVLSDIGTEDLGHNISAPGTLYAGSTASEMPHLYYNTLGNKSICDPVIGCGDAQVGWGLSNTGPFSNLQPVLNGNNRWTGTTYAPNTQSAFIFNLTGGSQFDRSKINFLSYVWAVHDDDVGVAIPSAVPIPAAAWLFGSGLIGLIGIARKHSAH